MSQPNSAGMPPREIAIANRHPRLRFPRAAVIRALHTLDAHAATIVPRAPSASRLRGVPAGELSLVFLSDAALARLHDDFLDDPTTTDVITFEGEAAFGTAGEICVSADTAAAYAREHGRDFSTELTLYVVHGWLHLAGFDDLQPQKKRAMRRAEARAMRVLQAARAVPRFQLARRR
jgi:probable rRNA maturation factor